MFQKYESVLTNALNGSSEKAKAYLSDINSFVAKTNFQLDELTDDFIKFVNRGVTPSMDAMKKMGDFTNTVAKPFIEPNCSTAFITDSTVRSHSTVISRNESLTLFPSVWTRTPNSFQRSELFISSIASVSWSKGC